MRDERPAPPPGPLSLSSPGRCPAAAARTAGPSSDAVQRRRRQAAAPKRRHNRCLIHPHVISLVAGGSRTVGGRAVRSACRGLCACRSAAATRSRPPGTWSAPAPHQRDDATTAAWFTPASHLFGWARALRPTCSRQGPRGLNDRPAGGCGGGELLEPGGSARMLLRMVTPPGTAGGGPRRTRGARLGSGAGCRGLQAEHVLAHSCSRDYPWGLQL